MEKRIFKFDSALRNLMSKRAINIFKNIMYDYNYKDKTDKVNIEDLLDKNEDCLDISVCHGDIIFISFDKYF